MVIEYFIDTNTVIDYLDDKLPEKTNQLIDRIVSKISVITRMELLSWPGASESQTHVLSGFIKSSEVFGLEEPIIVKTIRIRKNHKTKLPDSIIAAIVIVNNLTLITRNIKDFEIIDGFAIVNPFAL